MQCLFVSFFSTFDNLVRCIFWYFVVLAYDCWFESIMMPRVHRYGNCRQLSELERGRIVGLHTGGFSYREITNSFNRNQSSIVHCYQAWIWQGQERRKRGTKGEEEQMSWKFATFDLWQQRTITITNRSRSPHIAEHNVNLLPWSSQSPNLEACLGHYGEKTEEFPASSGNAASSSARKNQPSARIDDSTRGGVCIHPGETNPLLKKCLYINLMNCYLFIVKRSC